MSIYFLIGVGLIFFGSFVWIIFKAIKKKIFCLMDDQEGYTSSNFDSSFIGQEGIVISDLRPSGFIEINGVKCQAMSEGEYLKKDIKVKVIDGEGSHLIVKQG